MTMRLRQSALRQSTAVQAATGHSRGLTEPGSLSVVFIAIIAVACVLGVSNAAPPTTVKKSPAKAPLTFERHVAPILKARCFTCHGAKRKRAGLDLRRRFTILIGGDSGPAIVPGKPKKSPLIEAVMSGEMPPEGKPRLSATQIAILKRWVASGAQTLNKNEPPLKDAGREVSEADRRFWSFRTPKRPQVPDVRARHRARTPIDAFLLAKLESKGGGFNPDASRRVLIRRVYFDVLGLPPTPEEVTAFVNDKRPDAYERVVDRLLASPRYGERWGRHWLDVAGYTDTDGFLDAEEVRKEFWRYRDYVIRAHNADKPYDRFVLEQLAGDELTDWRRAKTLTPKLRDGLIATGFLRTGLELMILPDTTEPAERHKLLADTMEIVGSSFLGLTIQCARCHTHKFDPIPHTDYYRLQAVFLSSYDPKRWIISRERGCRWRPKPSGRRWRSTTRRLKNESLR